MINSKTVEEKKVTSKQNPTDTSVPGPIIIAPRIESMEVTLVMGDQRSSYMNFNGGEAYMDDPYDDGLRDDDFEDVDYDGEGINDEGVAVVMDEIDRSGCRECEFTDCVEHPMSREAQRRVGDSTRQPQDTRQPQAIKQTSKFTVTEGEAALEGMPELFKLIFKLLKDAGKDVEVKRYEQRGKNELKEDQSDE